MLSILMTALVSVGLSVWGNLITSKFDNSVLSIYSSKTFLFENEKLQKGFKKHSAFTRFIMLAVIGGIMLLGFYWALEIKRWVFIQVFFSMLLFAIMLLCISKSTKENNSDNYDKTLSRLILVFGIGYMDIAIVEYFSQVLITNINISRFLSVVMFCSGAFIWLLADISLEMYKMKTFLKTKVIYLLDKTDMQLYKCSQPLAHLSFKGYVCHVKSGNKHFFVTSNFELFVTDKNARDELKHVIKRSKKNTYRIMKMEIFIDIN